MNAVKLLIYGSPGAGKTEFLASADKDERTSPLLWLDLEGGTSTFESRVRKIDISEIGNPVEGMIDVVRIKTWDEVKKTYDFLWNAKYTDKRAVYKALAMDSLTEINDFALQRTLNESSAARLEPGVPEQRDYLKTNQLMKKMLRGLRDIEDLSVFMTALPKEAVDLDGGIQQIQPALIGKLSYEAMAMVDFGVYLRVNSTKKQRELHFDQKGKAIAKRRDEQRRFIEPLLNPTMTKFLDVYEGKVTLAELNKNPG